MSWNKRVLSDCVQFIDGDRGKNYPRKQDLLETGSCLFLDTGNVTKSGFDFTDKVFISEEKDHQLRKGKLQREDVVLTTRGTLGNVGFFSDSVPFESIRINSGMLIMRAKDELNSGYLYYWLQGPQARGQIQGAKTGSAQPQLPVKTLSRFRIEYPNLDTQKRIVDVLAKYDALIENNRKQIKLLEEAARRLYKEWFIDLRFPGYEDAEIDPEAGLPEGWKRLPLGSYATFRRGKIITEKQTNPGTVPVVAGGLGPAYYHDKANTVSPVITVSGSGANAGFTRLYTEDIWASDCSYVDASSCDEIFFIYETVLSLGNGFKHLQRGSAQPHVYPKNVNELEIVLPTYEVLKTFESLATELFQEVKILTDQADNAREARDRLLPVLLSCKGDI